MLFEILDSSHFQKQACVIFCCLTQLLCTVFGLLTNQDSLQELTVTINAHEGKSYHLIFGKSVTWSNLAKASVNMDYRIFEEFAYYLTAIGRKQRENHDSKIKGQVYAFDSTTIGLCLSVFWWAKFRKRKGGIKLNTLSKPAGFLQVDQITPDKIAKASKLNNLARQRGQSLAQMAIAWILRDHRITSVLIGASSVNQLENNLGSLNNLAFNNHELKMIDEILA